MLVCLASCFKDLKYDLPQILYISMDLRNKLNNMHMHLPITESYAKQTTQLAVVARYFLKCSDFNNSFLGTASSDPLLQRSTTVTMFSRKSQICPRTLCNVLLHLNISIVSSYVPMVKCSTCTMGTVDFTDHYIASQLAIWTCPCMDHKPEGKSQLHVRT